MWQSSSTWEKQKRTKLSFIKKLRAHKIRGILATIPFKVSCFLISSLKTKIYNTIILPVILYGYETQSLTLREEHGWSVFENRVLGIFGPKMEEVAEGCIMRSFRTCMINQILFRLLNHRG
jgi:hypothetical protein